MSDVDRIVDEFQNALKTAAIKFLFGSLDLNGAEVAAILSVGITRLVEIAVEGGASKEEVLGMICRNVEKAWSRVSKEVNH